MHRTTAALIVAAAATTASAQLTLIDLPTGYEASWVTGISTDGSVLGFNLLLDGVTGMDSFTWSDAGWESVPGIGGWNSMAGLSADGSARLNWSSIVDGGVLTHSLNGAQSVVASGPMIQSAALTSDGQSVFYSRADASDPARAELLHWRNGTTASMGMLPDRYSSVANLLAVSSDTLVFTAADGLTGRAVILRDGAFSEIDHVISADVVYSRAVAASTDGSVIIGNEFTDLSDPEQQHAAWIYRDGVISEFTLPGFDRLALLGITDDGLTMLVTGVQDDGTHKALLAHDDGRTTDLMRLFHDTGFTLTDTQYVGFNMLSGDGATVVGKIVDSAGGHIDFTLRVPAPGALATIGGLGLIASRRRR